MYLTVDEVRLLAQTECTYPGIKAAFLFSCLTGLQRSDVTRLAWEDIPSKATIRVSSFGRRRLAGKST